MLSAPVGMDAWMESALHDLCQPLTALQCRLVLGSLAKRQGHAEVVELRETVRDCLVQCDRLIQQVRTIQMHQTGAEEER